MTSQSCHMADGRAVVLDALEARRAMTSSCRQRPSLGLSKISSSHSFELVRLTIGYEMTYYLMHLQYRIQHLNSLDHLTGPSFRPVALRSFWAKKRSQSPYQALGWPKPSYMGGHTKISHEPDFLAYRIRSFLPLTSKKKCKTFRANR